ncbi:hypothetical protein [Almyronema epifaneia]|uniref:Uncharacterized protein n=1 Tax=Almyronema epifaneia S1 TaxID=2991925 RepID=A0ABW6IGC7_9CYAN
MTVKSVTRSLQTSDITVMSNVTSIQVRGSKITKIGAMAGQAGETAASTAASIYIDLEVSQKQSLPAVLGSTEELGLILSSKDAVELGLLLVAMGQEGQSSEQVAATLTRLSQLMAEVG